MSLISSVTSLVSAAAPVILLPLYIYPAPPNPPDTPVAAWQTLIDSLNGATTTQVLAVIDPANGPGTDIIPDANYIKYIAILNSYPNVRTLCYVHTTQATRPIADVQHDVDICAGWAKYKGSDIHMGGIFFDEAPINAAPINIAYMTQISTYARSVMGQGRGVITFNPGLAATNKLISSSFFAIADYINVFEDYYSNYSPATLSNVPAAERSKSTIIIHDFPQAGDQQSIVSAVRGAGFGGLLITTQPDYNVWSALWSSFYTAMKK